ncbi:MAG: hypothetical protein ACI37Q_07065 [Candidatus Gastranaerophilaceae bacterium]
MSLLSVSPVSSYNQAYSAKAADNKKEYAQVNFLGDNQVGAVYDPEKAEKTKKRKNVILGAAALFVLAAATWFFTKGKGKAYLNKALETIKPYIDKAVTKMKNFWGKVKNFFGFGKKAPVNPANANPAPVAEPVTQKPPRSIVAQNDFEAQAVRNINTTHVDAKTRKLVDEAAEGTITRAEQEAYNRSVAYVKPTAEEQAAIRANNAVANRESAISRQVQNNVSEETAEALNRAKAGMQQVNTSMNGVFHNGTAEFTVKNGQIVSIKEGNRVMTKPATIAKYEAKHGVNLADLKQGNIPPAPKTQKQLEIEQAWAELEAAKPKAPTPSTVSAEVQKQREIERAWAEHDAVIGKTPKQPKTPKQREIEQAWAELEAAQRNVPVDAPKIPTAEEIWAMREQGLI